MRAAVFHGAGDIEITDRPAPRPGAGELLLEVAAVGICGTDAHEYRSGPHMFPGDDFVPGHEFAGHVVEVGEGVEGFAVGDLVATGAGISCGQCPPCRRGLTNRCLSYATIGLQLPGALAEFVAVPAQICLEVGSKGLSPDFAALAQPMSIAVHAARRGEAGAGEVALVIGAGAIGAFLVHALSQSGLEVLAVDLDPGRRELATALGAVAAGPPEEARDWGPPDLVYEVTGTPAGLGLALTSAAPGSRVVLVGLQDGPTPVELRPISLGEIELIGANAHVFGTDFPEAVRLLGGRAEGWSDIAPFAIPLGDLVEEGLLPLIEGRAPSIKTLIDPKAEERRLTS